MTTVKCPKCGRQQETDKQSMYCKNKIVHKSDNSLKFQPRYLPTTYECNGFMVTQRDKVQ